MHVRAPAADGPTRRAVLGAAGGGLVAAGTLAAGLRAARAADAQPVVETAHGRLRGLAADGVLTFKGVRYGETTAGANRFRPPVPVMPWAGVRDATAFGHSAPQAPPDGGPLDSWYNTIEPVSEDCLFLNVWTASLTAPARPVMVWLHGGAWSSCAGTAPGFDGTNLARDGDVVVVTINHRLNVFGYLSPDGTDERFADGGNAGVLDMVAALAWVRDSIGRFGGDSGRVTIFGQSGGASKVTALLALPAAHGLFHRAIVQSCSGGLRLTPPEAAAARAAALARALGRERADGAALQAVPMEALIAAARSVADPFRPVLDGRSFTANPYDGAPTPVSAAVPMLVGNAANEATLFLAAHPANLRIDHAEAVRRIGRFLRTDPAATARIVEGYRAHLPPDASPFLLLSQVATDYMYRRNTTRVAALKAQQAAPVHAYVTTWRTPVLDGALLSPHTVEVPFVFGTTRAAAGLLGGGADLAGLTATIMGAWSAFAHSGEPGTSRLPAWPAYTAGARETMLLDVQGTVARDPGGEQRRVLEELPFFEYSMPQSFTHP